MTVGYCVLRTTVHLRHASREGIDGGVDDDSDMSGILSPGSMALAWLAMIRQARFDAVWEAMTDEFRLVCVQDGVVNNPTVMSDPSVTATRDELAAALSAPAPTHPLWVHTRRVSERAVRSVTVDLVGDRELGVASRPRPIGPGLELIRLIPLDQLDVDESGMHVWPPGQAVQDLSILLRHSSDGWLIAGAGGWLPRPGWPPQFETVISPDE